MAGNQMNKQNRIIFAKEYLSQNLDTRVSLTDVAQKINISQFHFLRMFKSQMGVSPHQFRIKARIQAAKSLLQKEIPLAEIALETGFSDQSHFTNTFKKYAGVTPKKYIDNTRITHKNRGSTVKLSVA